VNVLSLFSGVGGLCSLGLGAAGHDVVGLCEIDAKARSVLRRHHPDTPIWEDVTTLDGSALHGRVDIVAGGSPCQDLSVAGRRAGLDGERSGLFWHQCRIAAEVAAPWVLWENVAGALSSNDGEDFAAVLWGLTGFRPAVPEDGWRKVGVCVGPDRTAVWRLLDARWFGVAQRRRRVFVVAGPRDLCGPEVLVEPESCGGDTWTRPTPGQEVAGTLGGGAGSRGWCADTDRMTFVPYQTNGDDTPANLSPSLDTRAWQGPRRNQSAIAVVSAFRGDNLNGYRPGVGPLRAHGGDLGGGSETLLASKVHRCPRGWETPEDAEAEGFEAHYQCSGCLRWFCPADLYVHETSGQWCYGDDTGNGCLRLAESMPTRWVGGAQQDEVVTPDGYVGALAHASNHHGGHHEPKVLTPDLAVRRLTPRECERLMGWPDDHTRWADDGTEIADSHRYRMCGNGVVAPVAEWIGHRLMAVVA